MPDRTEATPERAGPRPVLRAAAADDVESIARLWHAGWQDGHLGHVPAELTKHRSLADFRRRVPARIDQTTVAVVDGRVVGFVTVHEDEVEQIYVATPARGGGVAGELLQHGERVVAASHDTAWLAVASGNARARRFYERSGWHDTGAVDYQAEIDGGTFTVPCRRYEKRVRRLDA